MFKPGVSGSPPGHPPIKCLCPLIELTVYFFRKENMSVKETLGFDGFKPEDRWLWFAVRLSLVLFLIGAEIVVILAFAKIMLAL